MSGININSVSAILGATTASANPPAPGPAPSAALLTVNTATSLSTSPLLIDTTISPLRVLSQASQAAVAATVQLQLRIVETDLTNTFNAKIASAEAKGNPTPAQNDQQKQIDSLGRQTTALGAAETQYGTNANVFADLTTQLANLQAAASVGDARTFDTARSDADTDVNNLQVVGFNPLFQDDGVATLKIGGLGIQSSSTYNLGTAAGKAAALAAIAQAQQVVSQSSATTSLNQSEAGTQIVAINSLISTMNNNLQQSEVAQITESTRKVSDLQQQLAIQLHLAELNLGNSAAQAQALGRQAEAEQNLYAPPGPGTLLSLFA